jgi:hypothetical protein
MEPGEVAETAAEKRGSSDEGDQKQDEQKPPSSLSFDSQKSNQGKNVNEATALSMQHLKEEPLSDGGNDLATFSFDMRRVSKDESDLIALGKNMQKELIKANKPANVARNLTFTEGDKDKMIDSKKEQAKIF